jgi:SpoVK/Ycf46/Vps4 family AAA+-type ATPase
MDIPSLKPFLIGGHPCIRIVTNEEPEAEQEVIATAIEMGLEPWSWTAVRGLRRTLFEGQDAPIAGTENPAAAMVHLARSVPQPILLVTLDLADHLSDPRILRAFRETVERFRTQAQAGTSAQRLPEGAARHGSRLVMIDHADSIPPIAGFLSTRIDIPPPDDAEIERIIRKTIARLARLRPVEASMSSADLKRVVEALRGLTRRHAEQLIVQAAADDWKFNADDLPRIIDAKRRLLADTGVLEFVDSPTSLDDIGGLTNLKRWLAQRESAFHPSALEHGVTPPRGVLLLGVQGAGKSLCAKAIATAWKRPLMRLDPGALYDRFIGETERRLRDALSQADAMSPVVLWIDEIEKGFSSAASANIDGGLSRRIFGTLLTWMQEHRSPVFLVATANDINALPPELLRKGRFDEIFFVDLPSAESRRQIFTIHLRKAKQTPASFDLDALAAASEGYSGAEIEQAVRAALVAEFAGMGAAKGHATLTTEKLLEAVRTSPPLSVTMAESVAALREWAVGRCVPAESAAK